MTKSRSNATAPAAKGQLVVGTGTDASSVLTVGSNNQVLTADSAEATGLKWATPATSIPNNASTLTTGAQTITSTSYTGLTTATSVTVTTGTKALVMITVQLANNIASEQTWVSWAVSGATTVASSDNYAIFVEQPSTGTLPRYTTVTRAYIQTGLTAGSNTFTLQYKVGGGTGYFGNRSISVVDMGS